jgi:hypothetical protein
VSQETRQGIHELFLEIGVFGPEIRRRTEHQGAAKFEKKAVILSVFPES